VRDNKVKAIVGLAVLLIASLGVQIFSVLTSHKATKLVQYDRCIEYSMTSNYGHQIAYSQLVKDCSKFKP
jgi:hypothetical protein